MDLIRPKTTALWVGPQEPPPEMGNEFPTEVWTHREVPICVLSSIVEHSETNEYFYHISISPGNNYPYLHKENLDLTRKEFEIIGPKWTYEWGQLALHFFKRIELPN